MCVCVVFVQVMTIAYISSSSNVQTTMIMLYAVSSHHGKGALSILLIIVQKPCYSACKLLQWVHRLNPVFPAALLGKSIHIQYKARLSGETTKT